MTLSVQTASSAVSQLAEQARFSYEQRLTPVLEPDCNGQAVAIHVDTGDYAIGVTHRYAVRALLVRHEPDGRIVTLNIAPPTDADLRLAARLTPGRKR